MSPILMDAVTKARRSPNAPKTKAQAQRRLARYQRLADAAGDKPTGRIASAEAQRLQSVIGGGKYGRGATDGRAELERQRIAERKRTDRNNDGWIDGQKPKGAKPRKTATKPPADDLDPSSPNYRFKDTGYVAGSRKELAADMIRRSGKSGNRLRVTDIDWKSLEENPREAAAVITKSNLFGQVDWAKHRAEGMTPEAGFLIDRVYASIGKGPVNDTPQGRKDYALGLESLRDRLEKAKTADEVVAVVDGIREEMRGKMLTDADSKAIAAAVERRRDAANKIAPLRAEMDAAYKAMNRAEGDVSRFKYEASKRERRGWKADPEITASLQAAQQSADKLRADYTAIRDRVNPTIKALEDEYRSASQAIMAVEALAVARSADHPTKRAWNELGPRFAAVANFRSQKGSGAFRDHVTSAKVGRMKDWSWADQETMTATKERKESVRFQLEVADTHERIGGRAVNAASTADLKKQFNLREVQSGNWVLRDVAAAKFHTEQTAGALSDLADVIGAPDGEVSLNGRIALAFGARGTGNAGGSSARAHYEAVHRVINLTKMSGGGTLAHEWFHALDNLVGEMEAARPGKASDFATETDGLPDGELKSAFKFLNTAMMEGNVQGRRRFGYTANDVRLAVANVDRATYGLGLKIKQAASAEDAIAAVEDAFPPRSLSRRGMKARRQQWLGIAAAHFGKKPDGGDLMVTAGPRRSRFAIEAERLDATTASARTYWAQPKEMAARAFQAYVEDRLAGQGRRNDYLSAKADNRFYAPLGLAPFPEGEERERINRAFDDLFAVLRKRGTLRKALSHGPYTIKKGRQAMTPAQGKARVKITAQGRKVSYGQAGNAKDGGPRVRPGTSKGDAYCARSAGQMRANPKAARNPNSPLRLSRARWRCSGENSVKKTGENALSPILFEAVAKARRSLPAPKNKKQAQRRAERYVRFMERTKDGHMSAVAGLEAQRNLRAAAGEGYGRGMTPGRSGLEQERAGRRRRNDKNNDGWIDGQKPKGAKPRKTATERPTFSVNDVYGRGGNDAVYASIKDMRFSELKALIQQEGLRANLPAPRTAADARKYIQVAAKETYGRRGDPVGRLAGNERTSSDPVRQAVRDATAKRPSRVKAEAAMSLGVEDITPNATRAGEQVGAKVSDAKANVMAISRLDAASLRQMAKDNPSTLNWAIEAKMTLPQMRRVHRSLTGQKLSDLAGFSDHQQAIRAALPDMGRAGRMQVKQKPIRKGATVVMNPILSEAVAKAARSLSAPKNKKQAERRAALYDRAAQSGRGPVARIAAAEAARQRSFIETGKYGRGMTEGRAGEEKYRADRAYRQDVRDEGRKRRNDKNHDGWVDGQKPAGAKPRKTKAEAAGRGAKIVAERKPSTFRIEDRDRDPDGLTPGERRWVEQTRRTKGDGAAKSKTTELLNLRERSASRNKTWAQDTLAMQTAMATRKPGSPQKSQWYSPDQPIAGVQTGFVTGRTLNTPDKAAYSRGAADGAAGKPLNVQGLTGNAKYSYERAWATARAKNKIRKAIRKALRALAA